MTIGNPAGIGPEVVLRALAAAERPEAECIVDGPMDALADRARRIGLRLPQDLGARRVDVPLEQPIALGQTAAAAGRAAAEAGSGEPATPLPVGA